VKEAAEDVLLTVVENPPVPVEYEVAVPDGKVLLPAVAGESGEEEGVKVVVKVTGTVTKEEMVVTLALGETDEEATDVKLEDDPGPGVGK
jgi:hypothetical protein